MIIFSLLALGLARGGQSARVERALILACALGSAAMNYAAADVSSARSVAAYVMPPVFLAIVTDRVIAVVRRHVLGMEAERSAWAALGRAALVAAGRWPGRPCCTGCGWSWRPGPRSAGLAACVLLATPLPGTSSLGLVLDPVRDRPGRQPARPARGAPVSLHGPGRRLAAAQEEFRTELGGVREAVRTETSAVREASPHGGGQRGPVDARRGPRGARRGSSRAAASGTSSPPRAWPAASAPRRRNSARSIDSVREAVRTETSAVRETLRTRSSTAVRDAARTAEDAARSRPRRGGGRARRPDPRCHPQRRAVDTGLRRADDPHGIRPLLVRESRAGRPRAGTHRTLPDTHPTETTSGADNPAPADPEEAS